MSPAYFVLPVTLSTASRRGADVPTTVKLATASSCGGDSRRFSMRLPLVS